ncbi:MAG: prolyl oligopeptidase family serine peptidase [Planctomycetota bacterium]|jgi:prolyl oligopeptidase
MNDDARIPPPPSTKIVPVVDNLHGREIEDSYRWLENSDDPEVKDWVTEQNRYTRSILEELPDREPMKARIEALLSVKVTSTPVPRKGRYFFQRREPSQQQSVLYYKDSLDGEEHVLVDPNPIRDDGTASLDWWHPTRDGKLLAYGISEAGSEMATLHVLDVDTGEDLEDRIPFARHSTVAWEPDAKGFYYTRMPSPGSVPPGDESYFCRVYHHRLGQDPARDPLVFGEDREKTDIPGVSISPGGRWLLVSAHLSGATRTDVYLKDLSGGGGFVPIIEGEEALSGGQILDDALYLNTNLDAPNYRLFRVDPQNPARENWTEVLPEGKTPLQGARVVGGKLFALYLENATSVLRVHDADGREPVEVDLPATGSVMGIAGEFDGDEAFFPFMSFHVPLAVYRLSLNDLKPVLFDEMKIPYEADRFEVDQVWYESKDGTKVSMFVGKRAGLKPDGDTPVLVTGYGGFNISITPYFSPLLALWMEAGGVFGVPNLRGGAEYGEEWHRGGMLEKKQNVFDDFHAAGEWFIEKGWTRPERMVAVGGSNGGTLVGAALTQRPDLYRTILCDVPVLDMLRYHHFLLARYWMGEYGDPDNPEHFEFLHAYSPYHQVKKGTDYGAVFVATAESDSRVDPMHARKMAARLRACNASQKPILFWEERRAGHGMGTPLAKRIEEVADRAAFVFWGAGIRWEPAR